MKRTILSLSILCLSLLASANSITGKVTDSNNQAIAFTNVTLKRISNTNTTKPKLLGTVTNEKGNYYFEKIVPGQWEIEFTFIGYKSQSQKITLTKQQKTLKLATITLYEDTQLMEDVEVIGQASQMRFDIDKKVFNVEAAVTAAGASASQMLENIPSVEVDQEGAISLRGNSSVVVWINGKPSGLDSENTAQILEQMPAESIEKVELITNPSAKYNPEGTAGIINLVLKKQRKAGYSASITSGLNYQKEADLGYNLGANFNYNSTKVDARINLGYRKRAFAAHKSLNRINYLAGNDKNSPTSQLLQSGSFSHSYQGIYVNASLDYHLNNKHTLGVNYMTMQGNINKDEENAYQTIHQTSLLDTIRYNRNSNQDFQRPSNNYGINHTWDIAPKANLMTSVNYATHRKQTDGQLIQQNYINPYQASDFQLQDQKGHYQSWIAKSDFQQEIEGFGRIEAGAQFTQLDRKQNSQTWNSKDRNTNSIQYNDFHYKEWVSAAYMTYGTKIGQFSTSLGIRGEYTKTEVETRPQDTDAYTITSKAYFEWYPTLFLAYALPHDNEIQINYTRRINRPRNRQINGFVDYSDNKNIRFGNPHLQPEFTDAFELNYIKSWKQHVVSASLYYKHKKDNIERVFFKGNDEKFYITYENINSQDNMGIELIAKNRMTRWLNITTTLNGYYKEIQDIYYDIDQDGTKDLLSTGDNSYTWDARFLANIQASKTLSTQISTQYRAPKVIAQGERLDYFVIDFGVKKSFLKRKLNISLNLRDVVNTRKWESLTSSDTFWQKQVFNPNDYSIRFNASYSFGNQKAKYKKRGSKTQHQEETSPDEMY